MDLFGIDTFVLSIPGIDTVGFFMSCSGLEIGFEVYEYGEGGNDVVHRLPGALQYPNLVLARGLTREDALLRWLLATRAKAERKEITLTLRSGAGERSWTFDDAFPVRWTGPHIDSSGSSFASESLEIAHGGLRVA